MTRHVGLGAGIGGSNVWFAYSSNSQDISAGYSYAGAFLTLDVAM
jgi:hypothetical protein